MKTFRSGALWTAGILAALTLGLGGAVASAPPRPESSATTAFERLKTLAGTWEANTEKGKISSSYEVVSNGSAILERVKVPGESEMITMYHLDGNHVVLSHYCTAGNQPRMETTGLDANGELVFNFTGGGNLGDPNVGHMHHAVLKFGGPDDFSYNWTFQQDGRPRFTENIHYVRVK